MTTRPRPAVERRRDPRRRGRFPATVAPDSGLLAAEVRDVSRSGLCVFAPRAIREMTTVRFHLDLPLEGGARRVEGEGAVVRCRRHGEGRFEIAVFFTKIGEEDREALAEYVRQEV